MDGCGLSLGPNGHERKLVLWKCLPLSGHSRYVETPQN